MSSTIQEKAINATRMVLFSDFNYNANKTYVSV